MKANLKQMVDLARAHMDQGGVRAAEVYWRMILKDTESPQTTIERVAHADACAFYARRAIYNGRHGEAADWYQRCVFADPLAIDYRHEFIIYALLPMGMFKNALIEAKRLCEMDPTNPDTWRSRAIAHAALDEAGEAAYCYDRQLELDKQNPLARIDRAALAINTGDYETAHAMVIPVLNTDKRGEALHTLALIAYRQSRHEDAIALFEQAIEAGSNDEAQVRWNMSLALHAIGRYREGWEQSEYRGKQKGDEPMRLIMNRFAAPIMSPGDLATPQRVHVHQEMGNGDAIAMARYMPLLQRLGHDTRLETLPTMVSLLARSFPGVQVMKRAIDFPSALGIPMFDRHIPTLSLPYIFGTDITSVPWEGPYIRHDPIAADRYRAKLAHVSGRKIGICWSSGIRDNGLWISIYGRNKSMHFDDVRPLIAHGGHPHDRFVSLQVGPERDQQKEPNKIGKQAAIDDWLPPKPTWDDTAALVANLDLVITVDTAIAHLAGAMGKPVWVMMQKDGSTWHFMCERDGALWNEKSPWYPSARLFRKGTFGQTGWDDVITNVATALREWTNDRIDVRQPRRSDHDDIGIRLPDAGIGDRSNIA